MRPDRYSRGRADGSLDPVVSGSRSVGLVVRVALGEGARPAGLVGEGSRRAVRRVVANLVFSDEIGPTGPDGSGG